MEETAQRRKLTWEQESLCAKVRVIDDPERLAQRLQEIDPSVYRDLLTSLDVPPSPVPDKDDRQAAADDLVLALTMLAEGCFTRRCEREAEVVVIGFGPDGRTLPGFFCARHVPSRTRLRKLGFYLAATLGAVFPLLASAYVTDVIGSVGIRKIPRQTLRCLALRRSSVHDPTPEEIARLEVNFIRHELTKYDDHLDAGLDVDGIRKATYQAISLVYPDLADECARQYSEKSNGRILGPIIPGVELAPTAGLAASVS